MAQTEVTITLHSTLRRKNTVNGNPRFILIADDGRRFITKGDSHVNDLVQALTSNGSWLSEEWDQPFPVVLTIDGRGLVVSIRRFE